MAAVAIKVGPYRFDLPPWRALRIAIGVALVIGGLLGFLPILGFWMLPLGLIVLAHDLPPVRRFNRKVLAWWRERRTGYKE